MRAWKWLGATTCVMFILAGCEAGGGTGTTVRGPGGQKMTLKQPGSVSIERGEAEDLTVRIDRAGFSGAVTINLTHLPTGVTAVDMPRDTTGTSITVVLRASNDADLVSNHVVHVTAEGPNDMKATETLRMTVREHAS